MIRHIGFCCMSKVINTKYKTFRLKSFTEQRWNESIYHNLTETEKLIDYCIEKNMKIIRLSSDLIPFATHDITKNFDYLHKYRPMLQFIGQKILQNNIRCSMHPSQIVNLGSPNIDVVKMSIKELIYHYNLLKTMGLKEFDIIIHVGGTYGDKKEAMKRFIKVFNKLPEQLKQHIVLENDDKSYTIHDVMVIYKYCKMPIVLDIHHHYCNPSTKLDLETVFQTWHDKIPKIHISSPKSNTEPRSHADYIDYDYIKSFIEPSQQYTFDIMVEAKAKDLAVYQLQKDLNKN